MIGKKQKKAVPSQKETELQQLVEMQVSEMADKDESLISNIKETNELLMNITRLDYVKDMVMNANEQADMLEMLAASSEEMAAATVEISNYVQDSNVNMKQTMENTAVSLEQVDTAFKNVEDNIRNVDEVKQIMEEVTAETVKINEIVSVITAVADQTNLLSLNASIEAARAGEHGRGFAVVADEIKKLAVNTKDQVVIIGQIVDGLNAKIAKATSEIGNVVDSFDSSKDVIDSAIEGIENINVTMGEIEESFTSISANVEEQTATAEEMSANLQVINEKSMELRSESTRTGQALYDISAKVDEIRLKDLNAMCHSIDNQTMADVSLTDHLMWKWKVYNMILDHVTLDVDTVGDHKTCRLGQWLQTLDQSNTNIQSIMAKMEQPHATIHKAAKQAIEEYLRGDKAAAERSLESIDTNSQVVVGHILELKNFL